MDHPGVVGRCVLARHLGDRALLILATHGRDDDTLHQATTNLRSEAGGADDPGDAVCTATGLLDIVDDGDLARHAGGLGAHTGLPGPGHVGMARGMRAEGSDRLGILIDGAAEITVGVHTGLLGATLGFPVLLVAGHTYAYGGGFTALPDISAPAGK